MIYVLGVFECGCFEDSCFSSLEVVKCKTNTEVVVVVGMMNQHSANYQCSAKEAKYVLIFEGKLEEVTKLITKPKGIENKNLFNFESYNRMWTRQGKELEQTKRDLEEYEKRLEEEAKR